MFSFFKRKPKEDWRLVKTISHPVTYGHRASKDTGIVYFHLFESNTKRRKVEIKCTFAMHYGDDLEVMARKLSIYQETIYRWENGRVDPDIPRYDQIPEEETSNVLRGAIS